MLNLFFLLLISSFTASKRQNLEYKCHSKQGQNGFIQVLSSSKPLNYLKSKLYLTRYVIRLDNKTPTSFYLYKFNNKLYILDEKMKTVNHEIDPVLFSIPHQESYRLNIPNLTDESAMVLMNSTVINGIGFYKYDFMTRNPNFKIREIMFDKNLYITELKLADNQSECTCTKTNIIIRLRQR